jgi:hypothetical protein
MHLPLAVLAMLTLLHWFNRQGGHTRLDAAWWIVWTTLEATAWAWVMLAWMGWRWRLPGRLEAWLAGLGAMSFSVYVMHNFVLSVIHKAWGLLPLSADPVRSAALNALLVALPLALLAAWPTWRPSSDLPSAGATCDPSARPKNRPHDPEFLPSTATESCRSAVLPAYNHEAYIACDRQRAGAVGRPGLIVIDDGSRDRTAEIIAAYDDPRIRFVRQSMPIACHDQSRHFDARRYVAILNSTTVYPERLARWLWRVAPGPTFAVTDSLIDAVGQPITDLKSPGCACTPRSATRGGANPVRRRRCWGTFRSRPPTCSAIASCSVSWASSSSIDTCSTGRPKRVAIRCRRPCSCPTRPCSITDCMAPTPFSAARSATTSRPASMLRAALVPRTAANWPGRWPACI